MRGTRAIYVATAVLLALIAVVSVVIYRATEQDVVESFSAQQLAVARTVAVALETEVKALGASLRQLNTLPSVQLLDVWYTGQRVMAAFDADTSGVIAQVVRIDVAERRYAWTTHGELIAREQAGIADRDLWGWFADRREEGQVRMGPIWWDASAPKHYRALAVPVWRVASSGENPVPPNDFNGVLAFVIDTQKLAGAYARSAAVESVGGVLMLDLGEPGARIGIGAVAAGEDAAAIGYAPDLTSEPEGTAVVQDEVWAWSPLAVPGGRWTVILNTPDSVSALVRAAGLRQLVIVSVLMVLVPLVAWVLVRREREAEEERRLLQIQLAQAQRMDAIGKLAGGIAHDFNNLLTAILGYVSLILEDAQPGTPIHDEATQIRRASESAAALTQKLLAFSRRQVLQPQEIDLAMLLKDILSFVNRLVGEHIRIASDVTPDLWTVIADPVQVEQAVINLAINARDAMPNGGTLEITAKNAPRAEGEWRGDYEVKPGDYVQLSVRDTGIGMDDATRARMFEPFFTTKPKGKGTGLGLATVWGIVKQSGGYIHVTSTPNSGTAIELLLPRGPADAPAPRTEPEAADAAVTGSETVLLVEDEEAVREFARTTLQRQGYRVLTAPGPEDALRIAHDFRESIALLLTDIVMPGMQGPELATSLRLMRPGVRVLFMSGYAAEAMTTDTLKDAALLQKPFSAAILSRAVRLVLDKQ